MEPVRVESPKPEVTIKLNKKIEVITRQDGDQGGATMLWVNKKQIANTGSKISQINIEHEDKINNCDTALNDYIKELTSDKYYHKYKPKKVIDYRDLFKKKKKRL